MLQGTLNLNGEVLDFSSETGYIEADYLRHIQYRCLVMSEAFIRNHFADIKRYANVAEQRLDDSDCTVEALIRNNTETLKMCQLYGADYLLIDGGYRVGEAFRIR